MLVPRLLVERGSRCEIHVELRMGLEEWGNECPKEGSEKRRYTTREENKQNSGIRVRTVQPAGRTEVLETREGQTSVGEVYSRHPFGRGSRQGSKR
jgi:hypothetical protein